jgi:hypothetical protein
MDPISKTFVAALEEYARREKIPVIQFRKGQRKDDVAAEQRRKFTKEEGVVFIGKAQEKTPVFRTERRRNERTGGTYPWLWAVLPEVQHVFTLQRQALPQRTSMPNNNWRGRRLASKPWTTVFYAVMTPSAYKPSATG